MIKELKDKLKNFNRELEILWQPDDITEVKSKIPEV